MLETVMLLKSFRVCREVSGNLMIYGPRKVHLAQPFRFRTRRLENAPPRAATANLVPRFLPTEQPRCPMPGGFSPSCWCPGNDRSRTPEWRRTKLQSSQIGQLILCRAFCRPNSLGVRCPEDSVQVAGAREMIVPGRQNGGGPSCKALAIRVDGIYLPSCLCSARSSAESLISSSGKAKKDHLQSR